MGRERSTNQQSWRRGRCALLGWASFAVHGVVAAGPTRQRSALPAVPPQRSLAVLAVEIGCARGAGCATSFSSALPLRVPPVACAVPSMLSTELSPMISHLCIVSARRARVEDGWSGIKIESPVAGAET